MCKQSSKPAVSKISEHLQHAGRPPGTPRTGGPNCLQDRMFRCCRFGMHVAVNFVANRQTNRRGNILITSTIRITASENPNGEIIRVLRSLIEPTRVESGCISCGLYKDLHDPSIIIWVEEWNTQDDLERRSTRKSWPRSICPMRNPKCASTRWSRQRACSSSKKPWA